MQGALRDLGHEAQKDLNHLGIEMRACARADVVAHALSPSVTVALSSTRRARLADRKQDPALIPSNLNRRTALCYRTTSGPRQPQALH